MSQNLSDIPIQFVKGVGPAKAKLLAELGILTAEDLLYFFPYRYEDRREFTPIAKLQVGQWQTLMGTVLVGGEAKSWFSRKMRVEIAIGDDTGRIFCVWFNQPYLGKLFKIGQKVVLYGKVELFKNRLQVVSPDFEFVTDDEEGSLSMGRIVPIYPLTRGVGQRYLRKIIDTALNLYAADLKDIIPFDIRRRCKLDDIAKSIRNIHFPQTLEEQQKANARVAFEEFFLFQVCIILRRMSIIEKEGIAHKIAPSLMKQYAQNFPFKLTHGQQAAIDDIAADMTKSRPMLRLLQGDVGCGKTVVAFFGCIAAVANGTQAAIMAPTEILANQHYESLKKLVETLSFGGDKGIRIALLTSRMSKKQKDALYQKLKSHEIDIIIGTHALLEQTVDFAHLSFVVIDEQHKFGVNQRALLSAKGTNPDVLIMTATPIPRTLCLTLYGDLDVSTIAELPPGRGKISTYHFPMEKAQATLERVRQWVSKGTQAYIIYPLVEESEKLDLKAATESFDHFVSHEFKGLRLALVHGQMDRAEVEEIMQKFKRHELDILVATTILEVGIDVGNANVMVIEHAERFGLSQLHQLRGRIGRSEKDAVCLLLSDPGTEEGKARLDAIVKTTDGFKIAEYDLEIRGPGHYFGRHQHGLNELRVANPITQMDLLQKARLEAGNLIQADSHLNNPEHAPIKGVIKKRYPQYLDMLLAG
ncbi:MAG: ATP-dependent DNA helicase RecG [Candidatus Omnitrophica bacterium]|nr:ATP-dependent DNA helicase RecG [Candidatus Omnitrophota bacterium]